jgi:hypothetical protein
MTRLKTCEACSRHVFVSETRCPFCGALCAAETRAPIFDIKAGMSRAQRFAVVAAVAGQTALVGCNAADEPKGGGAGAAGIGMAAVGGGGGTAGTNVQAVYGAPVPAGQGATGGSAGQVATPVYGAPVPPPDAGPAGGGGGGGEDGGTAGSGGSAGASGKGGAQPQPVYGAPVPLYGASPPSK